MTPEEKANELLSKMWMASSTIQDARECALIAVDEIMSQYKMPIVSHIVTAYKSAKDFNENFLGIESQLRAFTAKQILYWQEVKNEIEKL